MNFKLTQLDGFENAENKSYHSIPCIIHFLPGCNDYQQSWRELNPECIIISWDSTSLQKVVNNSIAKNIHIDYAKDEFVVSSVLCYLYGGIVISKPERCFVRLQNVLGCLSNTLLAVFALGGSSLLDNSILISSPKISAFTLLMEYFDQAKKQNKPTAVVFRDFVKSSMDSSNDGAIVCLHSDVKDKMTKEPKIEYIQKLTILENHLPSSDFFRVETNCDSDSEGTTSSSLFTTSSIIQIIQITVQIFGTNNSITIRTNMRVCISISEVFYVHEHCIIFLC